MQGMHGLIIASCVSALLINASVVFAASPATVAHNVTRNSIAVNAYDHIAILPNVLSPLSPTAVGAEWGDVYVGFSAVNHSSGADKVNGVMIMGMGLGNPERFIGVDVSVAVTSVNPENGGFAKDRHVDLKLHRSLPYQSMLAVGVENLAANGFDRDFSKSYYLVFTKAFMLSQHRLSISLGAGNGRFRSQDDIKNDKNTLGVFADVSASVTDWLEVFVDWSGNAVSVGASVQPLKKLPLTLTVAALDLTKTAVNAVPIAVGLGFSHRF